MSAITVLYNLDRKPVEKEKIQIGLDALKHRGNDGIGIWTEDNVGIGHRMNWSTPDSRNEQFPMVCPGSGSVLTGDIRIDNRKELIPRLFRNRKASEITDGEIVLAAYERWGQDMLPELVGDFAFALWDPKQRKLLCGRDSMGVKHFYYYYRKGKSFSLASEIKGLLCHPEIPGIIDENHIGDVLILNYQDKELTPFVNIKRLPANHAMSVDQTGIRVWQYWRPTTKSFRRPRSSRYYAEEFRELFIEAVECRMRSAGPAGSLLSGGLDSSSISAVASKYLDEQGQGPLETFSAVFPEIAEIDPRIDERQFIDAFTSKIRCNPNFVEADAFSPLIDVDEMQWHADHAIGAPNVFMDWALFKKAKVRGVNVLLSGFDGDSTVSYGYEAFEHLAKRGRWIRMYKDASALVTNMPARHHSLKRLFWKQGLQAAAPEPVKRLWRVLNGRPGTLVELQSLPSTLNFNYESINKDFAKDNRLKERYFDTIGKNYPEDVSPAEAHWNAMSSGLFSFALETFEKTGAAFGVEPRFPFFDRRLVDFSINLPPGQRILDGWTRSILRRAMHGVLPAEIQWRTTKANIGLSFKINLFKFSRDRIEQVVSASEGEFGKYVDSDRLVEVYDRYSSDPIKHDNEAMFLMSTIYLFNWLNNSGRICHTD